MRTIPLKILVLGSDGYIGGNFSDYLTKLGYEVIEFDIKMVEEYDLRVKDNT
jgi:nucleoside-diphosphate-sugar epimerase